MSSGLQVLAPLSERAGSRAASRRIGRDSTKPDATTTESSIDLQDPQAWDRLLELLGPASLLVMAEARMGPRLLESFHPEDVLQDVLLQAWSARGKLEWRGLHSFRNWLLTVLDNRVHDMRGYQAAQKRGGGVRTMRLSELTPPFEDSLRRIGRCETSKTPSQLAIHREQVRAMGETLLELPDDVRDVLRLRLVEDRSTEEVAERLGLGLAAVRYRLRRGSELYRERLLRVLRSHSDECLWA